MTPRRTPNVIGRLDMLHTRTWLFSVLGMVLVLVSCGGESPTDTGEYKELEQELAQAQEDLASSQQELRDAEGALDVARERLEDLVARDLIDDTLTIVPRDWRSYSVHVEDWMLSSAIELEFEVVSGKWPAPRKLVHVE